MLGPALTRQASISTSDAPQLTALLLGQPCLLQCCLYSLSLFLIFQTVIFDMVLLKCVI